MLVLLELRASAVSSLHTRSTLLDNLFIISASACNAETAYGATPQLLLVGACAHVLLHVTCTCTCTCSVRVHVCHAHGLLKECALEVFTAVVGRARYVVY